MLIRGSVPDVVVLRLRLRGVGVPLFFPRLRVAMLLRGLLCERFLMCVVSSSSFCLLDLDPFAKGLSLAHDSFLRAHYGCPE